MSAENVSWEGGREAPPRPLSVYDATQPTPKHFIANRWVAAESGDTLPMIDPSDGLPLAAIDARTAPDIDRAVGAAQRARDGAWGKLAPVEKGRLLAKLSRAILDTS